MSTPALPIFDRPPTRDEIQAEAVAGILRERHAGRRSSLIHIPTGVGKTRVGCKFIQHGLREWDGRFLVASHMGELLDNFAEDLDMMGIPYVYEKAEQRALEWMRRCPEFKVCLGSKDSLQKHRLEQWPRDFFTDLIFDECHLAVSRTWRNIHDHFGNAFQLGMTATIDRLDGVPLGSLYESVAYRYSIEDAIAHGHRCRYLYDICSTHIDIRGLKANKKGDFAPGELEARMGPVMEKLASEIIGKVESHGIRKLIAFLPDVFSAREFAHVCSDVGLKAKAVHGKHKDYPLSDDGRKAIIAQHKAGEFPLLTNKKLLGIGYNDPSIEAVVHLTPTTSRAWFDQASGRCGRVYPGKSVGRLIYFSWVSDLPLIGPTDIFAGDLDQPTREIARRLAAKSETVADPQAILEEAKAIREREVQREREEAERKLRIKARRREAHNRWRTFDPLGVVPGVGVRQLDDRQRGERPPAAPLPSGVAAVLKEFGIRDLTGLSPEAAKKAAEFWMDREFARKASQQQVAMLVSKCGIPQDRALTMTAADAQREIGRKISRWRRQA